MWDNSDFVRLFLPTDAGTFRSGRILTKYRPVQIAGARSDEKGACAMIPGAKVCRNVDLCKSPRRNLSENGPARRFRAKNLSECRPVQIVAPESAGMSTCANLSVAQVAFSTGFSLPRPAAARPSHRPQPPPGDAATAGRTDGSQKWALPIDYEASWGSITPFLSPQDAS